MQPIDNPHAAQWWNALNLPQRKQKIEQREVAPSPKFFNKPYARLTRTWKETVNELFKLSCSHPPTKYHSWFAQNVLCIACTNCGEILAGAAEL